MMRKFAVLVAFGFLSLPASAQSDYSKVELFGGYSFGSVEVQDPVGNVFEHETAEGFQAALAVNINRTFGIVTEFGGLWGDLPSTVFSGGSGGGTFRTLQVFVGPRFTKRMDRFAVFVHALPGFARQRDTETFTSFLGSTTTTSTSNGFAVALGGGVDVNLGKRLAIRAVQIDYLPTLFSTPFFTNFRSNLRVGIGLVLKFGDRP